MAWSFERAPRRRPVRRADRFFLRAGVATLACLATALPSRADPRTFQDLEARLSDALAAYDAVTVDRLWDDDLVFVFPNGHVSDKAERIKAQVPPPPSSGPRLAARNDNVHVQYEDAKTAIVLVRSSWRYGDAPPQPFIATHVWVRRSMGWRLIAAQVAQVAPDRQR